MDRPSDGRVEPKRPIRLADGWMDGCWMDAGCWLLASGCREGEGRRLVIDPHCLTSCFEFTCQPGELEEVGQELQPSSLDSRLALRREGSIARTLEPSVFSLQSSELRAR